MMMYERIVSPKSHEPTWSQGINCGKLLEAINYGAPNGSLIGDLIKGGKNHFRFMISHEFFIIIA